MSHGRCVGDRPGQLVIDLTDPDQLDEASPEAKALIELVAHWRHDCTGSRHSSDMDKRY